MTLYYSTFYYSISSRFRWKFEVPWRFFALLFDFWWVKSPFGRNSKLKFEISLRLDYNFEIHFLKIYQNRQISKVFCHKTFKLTVFSKKIDFCPHSRSNQSSLAYILRSQLFNSIFTYCLSDWGDFPLFDALPHSMKIQFLFKIELESVN